MLWQRCGNLQLRRVEGTSQWDWKGEKKGPWMKLKGRAAKSTSWRCIFVVTMHGKATKKIGLPVAFRLWMVMEVALGCCRQRSAKLPASPSNTSKYNLRPCWSWVLYLEDDTQLYPWFPDTFQKQKFCNVKCPSISPSRGIQQDGPHLQMGNSFFLTQKLPIYKAIYKGPHFKPHFAGPAHSTCLQLWQLGEILNRRRCFNQRKPLEDVGLDSQFTNLKICIHTQNEERHFLTDQFWNLC